MFKRTCKTCIHYRDIPQWKSEKNPNDFTGHCTLYPPALIEGDQKGEEKPSITSGMLDSAVIKYTKEPSERKIFSLFRFTRKTDYCGQHTTRFREIIERFYPVIYVVVGSVCTTIGAYILHILTKP